MPLPTPDPAVSHSEKVEAPNDDLSNLAAATPREEITLPNGFELVLGPMQVTSLGFVLLVVLVIGCGVAYAVGKAGSKYTVPLPRPASQSAPEPQQSPALIAPITASIILPTTPQIPADRYASLFGAPFKGQLYIQMGAVDRGMAIVFAQGLQKMGFKSTIIPGPSPQVFRVILGPFAGTTEFNNAKLILDDMGLDTFARRFDDPNPPAVPSSVPRPTASSTIAP
ncbi:MAG: hypothetical protein ABI824_11350 [Acidobacteriota bacterium]